MKKIFTFAFLVVLLATTARAQNYSIDWFTIDGGGGTSSGGAYSLSGTIGQPDAGVMSGGQYSLVGGFWGIISVIQTPGAPLLSVEHLPNGSVRVYWPLPADGWLLDQTPAFGATPATTAWLQTGFPYSTNATQISVTVPAPAGNRFYRLRRP